MELFPTEIETSLNGLDFLVGSGSGAVDKRRSGNQEFRFGNAELQISIRYPHDIRKAAGHTNMDLEEMFKLEI